MKTYLYRFKSSWFSFGSGNSWKSLVTNLVEERVSPKPVLSVSLTGLTVSPLWQPVSLANISLTVRATGRALVVQVTPGALLTSQGRMGWSLYPSSFLPTLLQQGHLWSKRSVVSRIPYGERMRHIEGKTDSITPWVSNSGHTILQGQLWGYKKGDFLPRCFRTTKPSLFNQW